MEETDFTLNEQLKVILSVLLVVLVCVYLFCFVQPVNITQLKINQSRCVKYETTCDSDDCLKYLYVCKNITNEFKYILP